MNYFMFGGPATRAVKSLIIVNVGVFVLQVFTGLLRTNFLEIYFGLVPVRVTQDFMIWQFVSEIPSPIFHTNNFPSSGTGFLLH